MASLQAYDSHGHRYYRIVESFRQDGKPRLRVVAHLGRVEDILRLTRDERADIKVSSVTSGAVTALHHLAHLLHHVGGSYSFPAGCNFENGLVTRFLST